MGKSVVIREAKKTDLLEIYKLVEELAIFEKARDEMWISVDYYEKEFEKGTFEAIVAEENSKIIGICIYYMTFSTWKGRMLYLEDFVVLEEYRKKGLGQLLYNRFIEIAKEKEATLVKWQVLDWNEPAVKFYEKNNAIIEKGWWNCKVLFSEKPKPIE